jgi:hypothetical protein
MSNAFRQFGTIAQQRRLSRQIVDQVGKAVHSYYHASGVGWDIGSYSRGTNIDGIVDIDPLFLGIPNDTSRGFFDWTDYDTYGVHAANELTDLQSVAAFDPVLAKTIAAAIEQLTAVVHSPVFRWLHSGKDLADVFFRIEASHPTAGPMGLDVTLAHGDKNFGLEHAQRFERYLENVAEVRGQNRAEQLLEDIRHLKRLVKARTTVDGLVDKRVKVPGFVSEALFTSGHEPRTFTEVIASLHEQATSMEDLSAVRQLPEFVVEQSHQLVDTGLPVSDVLHCVTQGGFRTLGYIGTACTTG